MKSFKRKDGSDESPTEAFFAAVIEGSPKV